MADEIVWMIKTTADGKAHLKADFPSNDKAIEAVERMVGGKLIVEKVVIEERGARLHTVEKPGSLITR